MDDRWYLQRADHLGRGEGARPDPSKPPQRGDMKTRIVVSGAAAAGIALVLACGGSGGTSTPAIPTSPSAISGKAAAYGAAMSGDVQSVVGALGSMQSVTALQDALTRLEQQLGGG